ncbi:MAG TPA: hypothetical protein VN306_17110, partial [Mycobacterium sp.]|nr:hypothetical protein [Mycobacterium sp.]
YPETAYGFATTGQTIAPVPDGTTIRVLVDEHPLTCVTTEVEEFERTLDMQRGVVERSLVYQLSDGRRFRVDTKRFVSLAQRHMACIRYEVTALDAPARLVISSELRTPNRAPEKGSADPRRTRALADEVLQPGIERVQGARVIRSYRTAQSELVVAAGMDHQFDDEHVTPVRAEFDAARAYVLFEIDVPPDRTVTLTKWLA